MSDLRPDDHAPCQAFLRRITLKVRLLLKTCMFYVFYFMPIFSLFMKNKYSCQIMRKIFQVLHHEELLADAMIASLMMK